MNKSLAIVLCSLPIALASTGYAQGTEGISGSGAASPEQQAESTHPSGLAGSTGAKRPPSQKESAAQSSSGTARQPAAPATKINPRGDSGTASNRSSSGSSTNTTANQAPSETGKSATSSKSEAPSPKQ